ncbi:hypothetical protein [Actinomadura sp. HBU206391]|uniref:hypothetical protein n=1 Tax=Actinomadura sp. HBU206391 TaxID=2731692 RepID=UPI00164F4528|nr:hypothetical protein [Actinomadura sp. HBU206391]MBC6457770.1 hypothetical protein [Actinomadura sp. HBU206391]
MRGLLRIWAQPSGRRLPGLAVPLKKDFCRLCWIQTRDFPHAPSVRWSEAARREALQATRTHQLFLANTFYALSLQGARGPRPPAEVPQLDPASLPPLIPGQLRLLEAPRDLLRIHRDRTIVLLREVRAIPHLAQAWEAAESLADRHGWSARLRYDVKRALVISLSCRGPDEPVLYSELEPLAKRQYPVARTARVLAEVGMLHDDRPDLLEQHWTRRLEGATPAIFAQADAWLRHLRDGGPRFKPRSRKTVSEYSRNTAPILVRWSQTYDDLREITRDEIDRTIRALPPGRRRLAPITALRSLFSYLRKTNRIFQNPTTHLKLGSAPTDVLLPLGSEHYRQAVAAARTALHHVALALAAVHAASSNDIQHMKIDDVDLTQRHITINGVRRHLDDLTRQALITYLRDRQSRWPGTSNPHLVVSAVTVFDQRPVSTYSMTQLFRGLKATIDQLRQDRILEEALTRGPDPLHLTAVFGISHSTAIRYSDAARKILHTAAENPLDQEPSLGEQRNSHQR